MRGESFDPHRPAVALPAVVPSALAVTLALVACSDSRPRVAADAETKRDAPPVASIDDRATLFRQVPTRAAIQRTLNELVEAGEAEAGAKKILAALGRMNLKTGVSQHEVWRTATDGWLVPIETKTRLLRNFMVIVEGRSEDAVIVGTRYDSNRGGAAALLEVARGFTALSRAGWRPTRTIVLAWFDGELGLGAWVEEQSTMLAGRALAYLDLGAISGGPITIERSAALADVVDSPGAGTGSASIVPLARGATAFWHRTGIASAQWRSDGTGEVETTATDLARSIGLAALHLADAEHVDLRYDGLATAIDADLRALGTSFDRANLDASREILRGLLSTAPYVPTPRCDQALLSAERAFLLADGLPTRPWFRHVLLGGTRTGDIVPLPELADAVAANDPAGIATALRHLTAALDRLNATLSDCNR